jgi:hypothetical protein
MLSSENLERDIEWYKRMLGFQVLRLEPKFALIQRDDYFIHLQKQKADSKTLIGGSVAKFFVDDIQKIFRELVKKNLINGDQLISDPSSGTIEFEITDPSGNTIIFTEEKI